MGMMISSNASVKGIELDLPRLAFNGSVDFEHIDNLLFASRRLDSSGIKSILPTVPGASTSKECLHEDKPTVRASHTQLGVFDLARGLISFLVLVLAGCGIASYRRPPTDSLLEGKHADRMHSPGRPT